MKLFINLKKLIKHFLKKKNQKKKNKITIYMNVKSIIQNYYCLF